MTTYKQGKRRWKVQAAKVTSGLAIGLREATSKWFGLFWLSLTMTYQVLLSIENYWQALPPLPFMGGDRAAFLPKLFIQDSANLGVLQQIWGRPDFWIAVVFCLAIQTVQANGIRARGSAIVKANNGDREFSVARINRAKGSKGILLLLFYAVDIWTGWVNFPLVGVPAAMVPVHALWLVLSVFGAEWLGNAVMNMKEEVNDD